MLETQIEMFEPDRRDQKSLWQRPKARIKKSDEVEWLLPNALEVLLEKALTWLSTRFWPVGSNLAVFTQRMAEEKTKTVLTLAYRHSTDPVCVCSVCSKVTVLKCVLHTHSGAAQSRHSHRNAVNGSCKTGILVWRTAIALTRQTLHSTLQASGTDAILRAILAWPYGWQRSCKQLSRCAELAPETGDPGQVLSKSGSPFFKSDTSCLILQSGFPIPSNWIPP